MSAPATFRKPPWKSAPVPGVDPLAAPDPPTVSWSGRLISASSPRAPLSATVVPSWSSKSK
ncbi:MAG: hypothetical protein VYC70_05675 [Verrucomicrobiota bacterium]|nr:hypothetical protein [Verrucomicrobiota bacterium]